MSRLQRSRRPRPAASPRPATRRARAAYHHGDLRTAVLDQVRLIIREQGVGFVSIREVARRVQVSHGAPAHHFGNKSGLLTAFAVQGYDTLAEVVRARVTELGTNDPAAMLEAMGQAYVRFAIENPEHFSIMFPGDLLNRDDPAYLAATDRVFLPLVGIITQAAGEGRLTAEPMLVATAAWALVHGLASLWLSGRIQVRTGATDAATLARETTHLFVSAIVRPARGEDGG